MCGLDDSRVTCVYPMDDARVLRREKYCEHVHCDGSAQALDVVHQHCSFL